MRFDVVSIFPEMFSALTQWGITGRACEQHLTSVSLGIQGIFLLIPVKLSMIGLMAVARAW